MRCRRSPACRTRSRTCSTWPASRRWRGRRCRQEDQPATTDATLVARMREAGAVLVGTHNMDEYAYGFTTENAHYGPTRNPHDLACVAGGSSGGSAAAVAARLVPLALGSDTNGSIRVPASLCGIWGLKPTYGRLSRTGSFPFVASLDHLGPFAASLPDLAACYDVLQGADPDDPACAQRRAGAREARGRAGRRRLAHRTPVRLLRCAAHAAGAGGGRPRVRGAGGDARGRTARRRARPRGGIRDHRQRRRCAASAAIAHALRRLRAAVARPVRGGRVAARVVVREGAARARVVSRARARAAARRRRADHGRHAMRGDADRHRMGRARRAAAAAAREPRAC